MKTTVMTLGVMTVLGVGTPAAQTEPAPGLPIAAGPFQPTMEPPTHYHF